MNPGTKETQRQMTGTAPIDSVAGALVYDKIGYHLGRVASVYVDSASGEPSFISVSTSPADTPHAIAPFRGAALSDGEIRLAYSETDISRAPRVAPGQPLLPADIDRLDHHYGLSGPGRIFEPL